MSANFKIFMHRNSENLHLKLFGDFDGSAAMELISVIHKNNMDSNKIILYTSGLKDICAFGKDVFINNIKGLNGISDKITLKGEKIDCFSPG